MHVLSIATGFMTFLSASYGGSLILNLENDFVFGSDHAYTHGTMVGTESPWQPSNETTRAFIYVQQLMYTPDDIDRTELLPDDRAPAGKLSIKAQVIKSKKSSSDRFEFELGLLGPWSHSEETQRWVHDAIGSSEPLIWEGNQMDNEIGLNVLYEKIYRFDLFERNNFKTRIEPLAGFALGNIFTYANSGLMLRSGYNLSDEQIPTVISPTAIKRVEENISIEAFVGVEYRAVAWNYSLDGNFFSSSDVMTQDKEIFVRDFKYGVSLGYGKQKITVTAVNRTKEYKVQKESSVDYISLSIIIGF